MTLKTAKFLDGLLSQGILSANQENFLEEKFDEKPEELFDHLINHGMVSSPVLATKWADFIDIPWVDLSRTLFQSDVVELLNQEFCQQNHCIALYKMGNVVTVAMLNPTDIEKIHEIEHLMTARVSPVFSLAAEIRDAISIQFNSLDSIMNLVEKIDLSEFSVSSQPDNVQVQKIAQKDSIILLAQTILLWGVKEGASDIHIEPAELKVSIRFRVDGVMQRKMDIQLSLLSPLISRLKVLANVDLMEKRRPQDGRINLKLDSETFDFRFSCVPGIYGEKAVLRILGQVSKHEIPDLEELELSRLHYNMLEQVVKSPNGIFFVTGPTGSGKSTTLFSLLKKIDKSQLNVMTVENPVEYRLPGITQIEVNYEIGLDFATVLKSLLRQDPDVILLGEIRDAETAKVAAEAALTGHFVMSTLHTNNALQAVTRLIEIGVEPFLVAPAMIGVMAQRLLRRLCQNCREEVTLDSATVQRLFVAAPEEKVTMYRAHGCAQCQHSGYSGRIGIHEVLVVDDDLRSMIARDQSMIDIRTHAIEKGFESMRYDGMKKVLRGLTSLEELDRVTLSDTMSTQG